MALQEMQALLPSPQLGAIPDAKSPETNAQNSNNSKAAKVESAIEYIKQLKQEVSERDDLINKKDQEMDALKKELAALKRTGSEAATPEAAAQLKAEPSSSPNTENETWRRFMGDETSFFFFFLPQLFYTLTFDAQVLIIWPTIYSPYATLRTDHFLLPFQKQQIAIVDAIYRRLGFCGVAWTRDGAYVAFIVDATLFIRWFIGLWGVRKECGSSSMHKMGIQLFVCSLARWACLPF